MSTKSDAVTRWLAGLDEEAPADPYVLHAQRLSEVHGVEPYPRGSRTYLDPGEMRTRVRAILGVP